MTMEPKCTPPDIMVCYRVKKNSTYQPNSNNSHPMANGLNNQTANSMHTDPQAQANAMRQTRLRPGGLPLKQSKSRELRAGIMYTGCDCEKRNGLQDDCLRSECRGSPQCLTKPNPTCGPSEFSNGKHLELKRLRLEQVRKSFQQAATDANNVTYHNDDLDTGYQNHLFQNNNNNNNNGNNIQRKSTFLPAENHHDNCCCCCCCGDEIYHCVEGVVVEQNQNQHKNDKGGVVTCPGTAQCGPGLCPVGECVGGVCDIHGKNNHNHNMEKHTFGEKKESGSINETACPCNGRGRAH